jgi:hypothetical protein
MHFIDFLLVEFEDPLLLAVAPNREVHGLLSIVKMLLIAILHVDFTLEAVHIA